MSITEPPLKQEILEAVQDMKNKGMSPHLVLDAGLSISALDSKLPHSGDGSMKFLWGSNRDNEKRASCSTSTRAPQWLLIDTSDHGILPGSRDKNYSAQQAHLATNYPEFREASPGEYVSAVMITAVETREKLLPSRPWTKARTKDGFGLGYRDYRVDLGGFGSRGLIVSDNHDEFAGRTLGLAALRKFPDGSKVSDDDEIIVKFGVVPLNP